MKTLLKVFQVLIILFCLLCFCLYITYWAVNFYIEPSQRLRVLNVFPRDGRYPQKITEITSFASEKESFFREFNIYFVEGLLTNDPPETVALILKSKWFNNRSFVRYLNNKDMPLNNFTKQEQKQLFTTPWEFTKHKFYDVETYHSFTNRLFLHKSTHYLQTR